MSEKDSTILSFIANRLVSHYNEDENTDFVLRLHKMAKEAKEREDEAESGYRVSLNYFRESGKWYSEGDYRTQKVHLWEIWKEVQAMLDERKLPGLIEGHSAFSVTVDVPQHVHRHPHLITPLTMTSQPVSIVEQLNRRGPSSQQEQVEDADSSGADRERRTLPDSYQGDPVNGSCNCPRCQGMKIIPGA